MRNAECGLQNDARGRAAGFLILILPAILFAQIAEHVPDDLQRIDVVEQYGASLPRDILLIASNGEAVEIGSLLKEDQPVLLAFYYADCPMLCSMVLTGLGKGIQSVAYRPGIDYRIVTISIDPRETPDKSAAGETRYREYLPSGSGSDGWQFFTADSAAIARLADAVGFRFFYVPERDEYAHSAVAMFLTPDGVLSRYLYGIEYKERDLRLALLEASQGRIGSTAERLLLYCFHYDPAARGYVLFAGNLMRLGGAITAILLVFFLWRLRRGELRRAKTPAEVPGAQSRTISH
ncbi:MAG: SCO family protein [Calditrichaeota bacterium]|nr:SCO family protein [Calditrichota bacterium]